MIQGKPGIKDKEVELANQTLLDLGRLVNQPTSLLNCIPNSERGSSDRCADYDVRDYPVYKAANRLIKEAKGGIWDLVIDTRSQMNQNHKQDQSSDDNEEDRDDDHAFTTNRRGPKRKSTGRPTRIKEEKIPKREASRTAKRMRHPSSSPLTEIEDDDDDDDDEEDEFVKADAWPLLGWLTDLWTRAQRDSEGMIHLYAAFDDVLTVDLQGPTTITSSDSFPAMATLVLVGR